MEGKAKKPTTMSNDEWAFLDRKALGTMRLCLVSTIVFNISKEKNTKAIMDVLARFYKKPLAPNKIFIMKNYLI